MGNCVSNGCNVFILYWTCMNKCVLKQPFSNHDLNRYIYHITAIGMLVIQSQARNAHSVTCCWPLVFMHVILLFFVAGNVVPSARPKDIILKLARQEVIVQCLLRCNVIFPILSQKKNTLRYIVISIN